MDQRPIEFLGKQIYTLSLFQLLMQIEEKKRCFLRETQEFTIIKYIYQEKEQDVLFFWNGVKTLWTFFFSVQTMQAVFSVASSVVPTTVIYFFSFSRTKCLLTCFYGDTNEFLYAAYLQFETFKKHLL